MTTTTLNEVRAEALFASDLQPSQHPAADQVRRSVLGTLHRHGRKWCAARKADETGVRADRSGSRATGSAPAGLRCLVVDDQATTLERLARLLRTHPAVGQVAVAASARAALHLVRTASFDVAFIETQLSGTDGVQLAWALRRTPDGPEIVFVTGRPDRAAEAFDLGALDYVTKPVVPERVAESLRRVSIARPKVTAAPAPAPAPIDPHEEVIPVSLAGSTKLVRRSLVRWAQAQGDYVRLHTAGGSYLIRAGMNALADAWEAAGFVRIHRSHLVQLRHVTGVQTTGPGQYTIDVGGHELPVSRRRATKLPGWLLDRARPAVGLATG